MSLDFKWCSVHHPVEFDNRDRVVETHTDRQHLEPLLHVGRCRICHLGQVVDPRCLIDLAARLDLVRSAVVSILDDVALHTEVQALESLAARWNVSGVPTFIFDRRTGFSGAQPIEVFERAFDSILVPTRDS